MKKIIIIFLLVSSIFISNNYTFASGLSSYILYEANSNTILKEKNIHKKHLTASISKILTALVVIENTDINEYVRVKKHHTLEIGSKAYLKENDYIQIKDALSGLLLRSGNDCAKLLQECVCDESTFVILLNRLANKIGMTNSYFNNPSGLDENSENYSTAYDMALLAKYAIRNKKFLEVASSNVYKFKSLNGNNYVFYNKHRLVNSNEYVIFGKTGVVTDSCEI